MPVLCLVAALLTMLTACGGGSLSKTSAARSSPHNVIIFVADGLRRGSVNDVDAPTLLQVRQQGVDFANSHSLYPTFTTPNASAIATGHYLGDTGDFGNALHVGFPIFGDGKITARTAGTPVPYLENDQVLADMDAHFANSNYLNEESLLAAARQHGYNTAAVGKLGPIGIQDVTELTPDGGAIVARDTIFIDDATGSSAGIPLSRAMQDALTAAGIPLLATARQQPEGSVSLPGTLSANIGQQQYFLDATTKVILPLFKASGRPFVLVYWSRDPDGSQHNQGDSLNRLTPGINGPTSRAGVANADANLKRILDAVNADAELAANTDIFVTSDHGFATISKHEVDAAGHGSAAYAAGFTYLDATNNLANPTVHRGWLPPGFLAIDIAHALAQPLFDPDTQVPASDPAQYFQVDPSRPNSVASHQRPVSGNGMIGGTGIAQKHDAEVVVAANGGSDLIYVLDHQATTVRAIVEFLTRQDYVGALFVDSAFGAVPGTLPLRSVGLDGGALTPRPSIVVGFKTYPIDAANPLQSAVQIADTNLQEGQGMHGSLGRDNTFNNMAAIGPDFKHRFTDGAPVGNADIARTLAHLLYLPVPARGKLEGRVLEEALASGPDAPIAVRHTSVSPPSAAHRSTILEYQTAEGRIYLDAACFIPIEGGAGATTNAHCN